MLRSKLALLLYFFVQIYLHSQPLQNHVLANAGGGYKQDNIEIAWTIGEPIIETFDTGSNKLTQGFHQCYYTPVAVKDEMQLDIQISYNYLNSFLELTSPENLSDSSFQYDIFDFAGRLVLSGKLDGNSTIFMGNVVDGAYIFCLINPNRIVLSHMFIKF